MSPSRTKAVLLSRAGLCFVAGTTLVLFASCERPTRAADHALSQAEDQTLTVGVVKVTRHPLERNLTLSSELVPFQEIDVFAKESGYIKQLLVDYGSRVKKGQLLAVLEIPELQMQLDQDRANIKSQADQVTNAKNQLSRVEAQHKVLHLEYQRFASVAQSKPGLVAQQEIDDVQGRDLAAEAQVEGARSNAEAAKSVLAATEAKLTRDQAVYDYSRITAPFDGVVTQRYANLGALLQSGTNSSTQAMPLVKLSEVDHFRLVIPIGESYVRFVHLGDSVRVFIPSLNQNFPGKIARFSADIHDATRTMHTEVDVPNPHGVLIPGLYAEATVSLSHASDALTIPLQAINRESDRANVLIVDGSNRVEKRNVVLGIETETEAEVLSGLKQGDRVVVSGHAGLNPGQTVKAQEAPMDYAEKS